MSYAIDFKAYTFTIWESSSSVYKWLLFYVLIVTLVDVESNILD